MSRIRKLRSANTLPKTDPKTLPKPGILDDVLQLAYPPEHRIKRPGTARRREAEVTDAPSGEPQETSPAAADAVGEAVDPKPIPSRHPDIQPASAIEIANCLWYLKTQYFKHAWAADEAVEDDARARRALGRINRGIKALADAEINLIDPAGERYPPGGEGLMRPIQFEPTAGTMVETVAKTVKPIILYRRHLIQRGEVLVAVPIERSESADVAGGPGHAANDSGGTANATAAESPPVTGKETSDPPART